MILLSFFFFQAEDGIRDGTVTGVQTCALPIFPSRVQGARSTGALHAGREVGGREALRESQERAALHPGEAASAVEGGSDRGRSEERRVGKECRARRAPEQ